MKRFGWSANDARMLMVNLFALGDASDGFTASVESIGQVSDWSGYGRMWLHWPNMNAGAGPVDPRRSNSVAVADPG